MRSTLSALIKSTVNKDSENGNEATQMKDVQRQMLSLSEKNIYLIAKLINPFEICHEILCIRVLRDFFY